MIVGIGNTFIQPNSATPPTVFPPFPGNAADNGLTVDAITGRIVLGDFGGGGGFPGQFLNNRFLNLNGFDFAIGDGGGPARYLLMDPPNFAIFGDVDGFIGNNGSLIFDFANKVTTLSTDPTGSLAALSLDGTNSITRLGDSGSGGNGTKLLIDDVAQAANIQNNGNLFLDVDPFSGLYRLGDMQVSANGNNLFVNDNAQQWGIGQIVAVTNLLLHNPGAGIALAYFDGNGNNPFLLPDPAFGGIAFISAPDFSTQLSLADAGSGSLASLGDVGAATTGMIAAVDVPNSVFIIDNTANNAVVNINGVAGFTGTVAPPLTITVDGGIVTNVA